MRCQHAITTMAATAALFTMKAADAAFVPLTPATSVPSRIRPTTTAFGGGGPAPAAAPFASRAASRKSAIRLFAERDDKIKAEMETLKPKKAGELKKELEGLGISTKSFFEKSEFVRALAEARVDGVKAKAGAGASSSGGGGGGGSSSKRTAGAAGQEKRQAQEPRDPAYRDVVCQKFDPRMLTPGTALIEIRLGK